MVTGSGFTFFELSQNFESGQKEKVTLPYCGSVGSHRTVGKMRVRLLRFLAGVLPNDDNPTPAHIASSHDDPALGADTKRNERSHPSLRYAAVRPLPAIAMIRGSLSSLGKEA